MGRKGRQRRRVDREEGRAETGRKERALNGSSRIQARPWRGFWK